MATTEARELKKMDDEEEHEDGCFSCCYPHRVKEDPDDHDLGDVPHHCTDILCLLIFIVSFVGIGYILHYSHEHGNMDRLYKGYNFLGELCGVEPTNYTTGEPFFPAVASPAAGSTYLKDAPKLFWCLDPADPTGTKLDLTHPVCRKTCPTNIDVGATTEYPCYAGVSKGPANNFGVAGSFKQEVTYTFALVKDYESIDIMGAYCFPKNSALMEQVTKHFSDNPAMKMVMEAGSIGNAWPMFVAASVLAVILGFIYLIILEKLACPLVYSCMVVLVITPLAAGCVVIYKATQGGLDDLPSTGDSTLDIIVGALLIILALVFLVVMFCANEAIMVAVRVIEATADCIMDMPSLLLEPLFTLTFKLLTLTCMMSGFLWLLSCGKISTMSLEAYSALPTGDISGVARSFTYKEDEWYFIMYYIFMIFWVMELATAVSQFVLAYAVKLWYFEPIEDGHKHNVPFCALKNGYCVGLLYHLGSFAFGSFIIACFRLVRLILGFIAKKSDQEGNAAAACIAKCLLCCLTCFQKCIEFLNKNAYIDIALNSNSFCWAAKNAVTIIFKNFPEIGMLTGACWIFQMAGIGAITGLGGWLCWLLINNVEDFRKPSSVYYISDPMLCVIICCGICFLISYSFMRVFDMVADTILYCKCNEQARRDKGLLDPDVHYAPAGLDSLINKGGGGGSKESDDEGSQ